jgi:hypothetical protein
VRYPNTSLFSLEVCIIVKLVCCCQPFSLYCIFSTCLLSTSSLSRLPYTLPLATPSLLDPNWWLGLRYLPPYLESSVIEVSRSLPICLLRLLLIYSFSLLFTCYSSLLPIIILPLPTYCLSQQDPLSGYVSKYGTSTWKMTLTLIYPTVTWYFAPSH